MCDQRSEEERRRGRVKVLADLQRHLHFFRERRRDVLGDDAIVRVQLRERGEITLVLLTARGGGNPAFV